MDEHNTCDGVVLHSDSELSRAEAFCERVNSLDCGDGQFPTILTFERFSAPGEQIISNLDRAVLSGGVIFCSEEHYREDPFGYFSANVAILSKCSFVKIKTRNNNSDASSLTDLPTIDSFTGLQVEEDWSLNELGKIKLTELLGKKKKRKTGTGMPELPGEDCLDIANPSMPSMTTIASRQTQDIARVSLEIGSDAGEVHPRYPRCHQSLQVPENSVSNGPDHTPEGTYNFSGEQVNAERNLPETNEHPEPVREQDPLAVSTRETRDNTGNAIFESEPQAPLMSPALNGDSNTQQREQSPRSHPWSSDFSLCSFLSRCSSKSCATFGAMLAVIGIAAIIGVSVHFSNKFGNNN